MGGIEIYDGDGAAHVRPLDMFTEYLNNRTIKSGESALLTSKPKYLIRVDLGPRSKPTHLVGAVSFWQFPRIPGLEALAQIYQCEDPTCLGMLTEETKAGLSWVCPKCEKGWTQDTIGSGIIAYSGSPDIWGGIISRYFDRLEGLAEILLMRRRVSVQKVTHGVLTGNKDAEEYFLQTHGGQHKDATEGGYFTLARILQDTATGSALSSRVASFLKGG